MALYNVGGHYFAGKGVELSFQKAAEYYKSAADKGFAPAQVRQRFMSTVPSSLPSHSPSFPPLSFTFLRPTLPLPPLYLPHSPLSLSPPCQVNLGNMYYSGLGVPKSRERAKQLYKMAADRDRNAKLLLEEMELEEKKEQEEKEQERKEKEDSSDDTSKS